MFQEVIVTVPPFRYVLKKKEYPRKKLQTATTMSSRVFWKAGLFLWLVRSNQGYLPYWICPGIFTELLDSGFVYRKAVEQVYCKSCNRFLPDRFVVGTCPNCKSKTKGDQCDACGTLLDPANLKDRKCGICGDTPSSNYRNTFSWHYQSCSPSLRIMLIIPEAGEQMHRDFPKDILTKDFATGPLPGFGMGYIRAAERIWKQKDLCMGGSGFRVSFRQQKMGRGSRYKLAWNLVRKLFALLYSRQDNIPFHTVILLPFKSSWRFTSAEQNNIQRVCNPWGQKISTSENWAVWIPHLIEHYNPDSIRLLYCQRSRKKDTDFSWREFINSHNGELLGAYGNFVNRSLVFIQSFWRKSAQRRVQSEHKRIIENLYPSVGSLIEQGDFKDATEKYFHLYALPTSILTKNSLG